MVTEHDQEIIIKPVCDLAVKILEMATQGLNGTDMLAFYDKMMSSKPFDKLDIQDLNNNQLELVLVVRTGLKRMMIRRMDKKMIWRVNKMTIRVYVLPEVRELARSMVEDLNAMADWQIEEIRDRYRLGIYADRKTVIEWMMQFRIKDFYNREQQEAAYATPWPDLAYDVVVEDRPPAMDWADELYDLETGVRW